MRLNLRPRWPLREAVFVLPERHEPGSCFPPAPVPKCLTLEVDLEASTLRGRTSFWVRYVPISTGRADSYPTEIVLHCRQCNIKSTKVRPCREAQANAVIALNPGGGLRGEEAAVRCERHLDPVPLEIVYTRDSQRLARRKQVPESDLQQATAGAAPKEWIPMPPPRHPLLFRSCACCASSSRENPQNPLFNLSSSTAEVSGPSREGFIGAGPPVGSPSRGERISGTDRGPVSVRRPKWGGGGAASSRDEPPKGAFFLRAFLRARCPPHLPPLRSDR